MRQNPARRPRRRIIHARAFARLRPWAALCLVALLGLLPPSPLAPARGAGALSDDAQRRTSHGPESSKQEFVPGEVLVRFRGEAGREAAGAALRAEGAAGGGRLTLRAGGAREIAAEVVSFGGSELVEGLRLARVPAAETLAAVEALRARADVLYAEPNYIWRSDAAPNDARYGDLWAMRNTGQQGFNDFTRQQESGTPGADIDAEPAWNLTTGSSSVVVAVLDGGVETAHADLRENVWTNPGEVAANGVDDDANGFVDDLNGWDFHHNDASVFDNQSGDDHGTHVAGTIGARGNNGQGVAGVNWQVGIMSVKVLGPNGGSTSNIISGYNYVRRMRELWLSSGGARGANVRVMNNSYGGSGKSLAAQEAISALGNAGVLFVAAAGNDATDNFHLPHYPSSYDLPNVVAVAATDRFEQLASFSNFGGRVVPVAAPGRGILSTVPASTNAEGYAFFSGTSMASPHVAGVAALALAANPGLSVSQLRGALTLTGDVVPTLEGRTTTGRRLNALAAVQSALEGDAAPPSDPASLRVAAQSGRDLLLAWTAPGDDGNAGQASDYDFFFVSALTGRRLLLPSAVLPAAAGTTQSATVRLPYQNFSGTVELRVYDNAGNAGASSVAVSVGVNAGSDPYAVGLSSAAPLSTGGTPLNLVADDRYLDDFALPFAFPFFGQARTTVAVSTNGALYFSEPPRRSNGDADDAGSSIEGLNGGTMIAGMWDDLRTDRLGGDVFVVRPDANSIVFRWQGATFDNELPFAFETELRADGTIIHRYGAGNTGLFPVVGVSAGEPDPYVVASHTVERGTGARLALTNAPAVTFAPRRAPANQIDETGFFVRQHYLDFLVREPDAAGLQFWTNNIESCGANPQCREVKRIDTSAAFFLSIEFQQTGYFICRLYRAAFPASAQRPRGLVRLSEFLPDTQAVGQGVVVGVGDWQARLEANRAAFVSQFVERPQFLALYPAQMTAGQFVDALNQNAGGALSPPERDALVAALSAGTTTRAQVLRAVAEDADFRAREFNPAFVLMQYFGYLRRNPDDAPDLSLAGYDFWLSKLNQFGGDFRAAEMVKSFLVSGEYRQRFGP